MNTADDLIAAEKNTCEPVDHNTIGFSSLSLHHTTQTHTNRTLPTAPPNNSFARANPVSGPTKQGLISSSNKAQHCVHRKQPHWISFHKMLSILFSCSTIWVKVGRSAGSCAQHASMRPARGLGTREGMGGRRPLRAQQAAVEVRG